MDKVPVFNILLLGSTQSGKSTFLEYARQYAGLSHKIDEKFIGGCNEPYTREPRAEVPGSLKVQFQIIDTPGLNNTQDNDLAIIARTLSCLAEVDCLHLVIIMDSLHVPLVSS
ncbi:hypothetical protein B0O80DRAFT_501130 [Mortierella sp. GBAus27b]|nr:hypothetical protein B0O80DRAFT_501130 [Mortierella sp. GBAus27b]